MTRIVSLNALKAGISRLRVKGSPDPQTLYDLVNGYVTQAGTCESRPGTPAHAKLPAGTKGLCAFENKLYVFSDSAKTVPAGYVCEILIHPEDAALTLKTIHYARPFMGALYVAAEWSNGDVFHYWLRVAVAWQANTIYALDSVVQPTVPNGFSYTPHRLGEPGEIWAPDVERELGDVVEPTTFNGYEYEVIEAHGSPPRSGDTEPNWPEAEGALVVEEADVSLTPPPQQSTPTPGIPPRYGNPGGSGPRNDSTSTQIQ